MKAFLEGLNQALVFWDTFYLRSRNVFDRALHLLQRFSYRPGWADMDHPGYRAYRNHTVARALEEVFFSKGKLPDGFGRGLDERVIEYPWLFSRLPQKEGSLLDAGSVLNFDFLLRRSELANKRLFISTLAPEPQNSWWRNISYTYEDLRHASFRDEYFDWIVCLSTIEHVGMDSRPYTKSDEAPPSRPEDALLFLKELHRMLKPGGTLFLSFPFGKKADLGWLQVFDIETVEAIVTTFQPRMESQNFYRHGDQGWKACTPQQAADAAYFQKDMSPNRFGTVAAEAVACLELVK